MSSLGAVLLALFAGSPAVDDVFVRDLKTIDDVVRAIHLRAEREKRTRLVVCLDDGIFEKGLWFDAISTEFKGQPFDVVITSRSEPTRGFTTADAGAPPVKGGVENALRDLLRDPAELHRERTPVLGWVRTIVPFARRGSAVVLVSSCGPEGSWSAPRSHRELDDCLDPCWHEEEVGARFAEAEVSLWIVGPQAPFGLDAAVTLCRFLPYANRPLLRTGRADSMPTVWLPPIDPGQLLAPEALEAMLKKRLSESRFRGLLPSSIRRDVEAGSSAETDAPSGTGVWSYARACFLAHGHCFVFEGVRGELLDRCVPTPRFDDLQSPVDRSAKAQWDAVAASPAVKHLRDIVARALAESREWFEIVEPSRHSGGAGRSGPSRPIDVFEMPGVPRTTLVDAGIPDERERDRWREFSSTLRRAVDACDQARSRLSHALDSDAVEWESLGARARNDALLELFWLKMSAFHLESLRVLTSDPDRFLLRPKKGWRHALTAYEAIRLSDGLEAYDGRRIAPETERRSELFRCFCIANDSLWQVDQSNELFRVCGWTVRRARPTLNPALVPEAASASPSDPDFRAQRDDLAPIANLDPSIKTRALDLIATAREIHDACRGTPWDWMVYYAAIDVYGFISEPDPQHIDLPPRSDLRILDGGLPVPAGSWSDPNPKARIDPTVGSEE